MKTRLLTKQDIPAAKELWGYAFETDEPFYTWYFNEVFEPQNALGIFIDEQLVSYLQLVPYKLKLWDRDFSASYIVGVITHPAYRNRGLMQILIPKTIEEINVRDQSVSILMPFETTFYKPYGWELCYSQILYDMPIDMLRGQSKKEGVYTPIDHQNTGDIQALRQVYNAFLKDCSGYVQRTNKNWEYILKDLESVGGYAYLLWDEQHNPVGYILYLLRDDAMRIIEMGYANTWAKKSLLGFIQSHRSHVLTASWPAPMKDRTYLFLKDRIQPGPVNNIKIRPFMCGRIINVKTAFERCQFSEWIQINFSIKVNDQYADWNNKSFDIYIKDGKCTVGASSADKPDISCDINGLSQLFFGALAIDEAIEYEIINLHNPSILKTLRAIFQPKNNFINEYF